MVNVSMIIIISILPAYFSNTIKEYYPYMIIICIPPAYFSITIKQCYPYMISRADTERVS